MITNTLAYHSNKLTEEKKVLLQLALLERKKYVFASPILKCTIHLLDKNGLSECTANLRGR